MREEPEIVRLNGLEAIRLRPSVYVAADLSGGVADHLLRAAMCHCLYELSAGTASCVTVTFGGLSAVIEDDGHGWPVDLDRNGLRYAELMLSELMACRDLKNHSGHESLCRVSLPIVVALSTSFILETRRDGEVWSQSYTAGVPDQRLRVIGASTASGTSVRFSLDPTFCGKTPLSIASFKAWLPSLEPGVPTKAIRISEE